MNPSYDETALRAVYTLRAQRLTERMAETITQMQDNLRLNQAKPVEFPIDDLRAMTAQLNKLNIELDSVAAIESARRATVRRAAVAQMMQLRRGAARLAA